MRRSELQDAIKRLNEYRGKVARLKEELPKVLATYGMVGASTRFNDASYDILVNGTPTETNIFVTAEPTENGYRVVANGREVCFVEFGAGVFYNGGESYLGTRPAGVVGIGEYGKGYGKRRAWGFKNEADELVLTRGTPAQNCMYYTAQEIRGRIAETARSILNGND